MNFKRKPQTGIILCRLAETEVRAPNRLLLSVMAMLLAAAWIGAVGNWCGVWSKISPWLPMAVVGLLLAGWAALSIWKKDRLFVPGVLVVLLMIVLLFGSAVVDGVCLLWNGLTERYLAGTGRILPELVTTEQSLLPALLVLGCLLSLLAIWCVQNAKSLTAIGNAIALILWLLLFRITELNGWYLFLLAVSLLLLLSGGWELHRKGQIWPLLAGVMVTAAASGLVLAVLLLPGAKPWAENVKTTTADTVHRLRFETEYTALPEGRLVAYDNDSQTGYTALLVTMEQPEELYLRGFVGEIYENGVWKEAAAPVAEKNLLHWLQQHAFYPQTQFAAAANVLETETNRISVQNVNACSRYVYTPYGMTSSSYLDAETLQPASLDANGSRSYTYSAVYNAAGSLQELLTTLQEDETDAVLAYRQAESAYRDLVYTRNLQVDEQAIEKLGEALDECCAEYGEASELTLGQAQDSALEFLSLYFGDKANEIQMILPHLQGTHYQYATVAAMALRYYGVPARYAEGFVIPQELADEGGQIAVDNSCAKAWVEVYQDGVGWLPLELTPGFEALAGTDTESGVRPVGVNGVDPNAETGTEAGEGEGTFLTEGKEQDDKDAEENDTEDDLPGGGTMMRIKKALKWTGILLWIAALLLLLLVIARRIWLLRKKRQFFETGDLREALGWIYADAALFLSEMGLDRGCGSMDAVCAAAEERFGTAYGKTCREMKQLNDLVLFSNRELEEDSRTDMLRFRTKTLSYMKKHAKWYRKLWLQWVPCVY